MMRSFAIALLAIGLGAAQAQQAPPVAGARILLVPRHIVSGERATFAVLDVNGRLTPGVTIQFSNGDKVITDATGRALFVAPLNPGVIFASIVGRPGRVPAAVAVAQQAAADQLTVDAAPRIASLSDRFELTGTGFCGDADKNQVSIGGKSALVLASSPGSAIVLPPQDLVPGLAEISVSCGKSEPKRFKILFVALSLDADSSPLQPGQKRTLRVRVEGTEEKIRLEAHNLAPDVADLAGGNPVRTISCGGVENSAEFHVTGKKHGSFLISIRLVSATRKPPR